VVQRRQGVRLHHAGRRLARPVLHTGILSDGYRTLPEGARVSYEEEQGDKGPKAVSVQKI
jgi:hypothetical protein